MEEIDAVALDETNARHGRLPAFAVHFIAEFVTDNFEEFLEDNDGVTGIWADDKGALALKNLVAQRAAPEVANRVENVIRVADAGDNAFRAVFEDVGVGIELVGFAPGCNGGVLGGRNAVGRAVEWIPRGEISGIKLIEKLNGSKRVRAEKIDEMRGAADGGRFLGRDPAKAEVVELERKKRRIASAG